MSRQKLQRFAELDKFTNVAQFTQVDAKNRLKKFLEDPVADPERERGKQSRRIDKNQEIILELACGKGDYSLALAKEFPDKKIIGIDIQGERLWSGAKQALEEKIANVFFLRIQIENLLEYFDEASISEIWITFPDPFPRDRQIKKRLTSPRFLEIYKKILNNNSLVHLKTDNLNLFEYSIKTLNAQQGKVLEKIQNIYQQKNIPDILKIKTDFEKKHLKAGKNIHYLKFTL